MKADADKVGWPVFTLVLHYNFAEDEAIVLGKSLLIFFLV